MTATKKCRVKGCQRPRGVLDAICAYHWRRVPATVRTQLWSLKNNHPPDSKWKDVLKEAIDLIERGKGTAGKKY